MELDEVKRLVDSNELSVCVIGIGRIGLPTALSFAESGLRTVGVDINEKLVEKIKNGVFPFRDEPGCQEIFDRVTSNGRFAATTLIEDAVSSSQAVVLSLPTPMDQNNVPDYTALRTVASKLEKLASPGTIIIVESTVEPGFIEDEFAGMVKGGERRGNLGIGVCPETANPGEIMRDFKKMPRLVGATDDNTLQAIAHIYEHAFPVELIRMPDCKTANAVKLTTNVFRDVNIAFVNELALLFEKLGIDTEAVLEAADRKYNFQIHRPGAGVGGPCLPVNSYQLLNSTRQISDNLLRMVRMGREINESMHVHVAELLEGALGEGGKSIESSEILIMGVSYKPNIGDIQLAPAEAVISGLRKTGARIKIFDPYFKNAPVYDTVGAGDLDAAISKVDAAVIVTAHNEFKTIKPEYFSSKMKSPIVVDAGGIIDPHMAKRAGLIFRGLGRGGF